MSVWDEFNIRQLVYTFIGVHTNTHVHDADVTPSTPCLNRRRHTTQRAAPRRQLRPGGPPSAHFSLAPSPAY